MKTKIHILLVLLSLSTLLQIAASSGFVQSSVTFSASGTIQQISTSTYSYIIGISGSNYQMKNGTTGQILFQSSNPTQVANNAIANLNQGGRILFSAGTYNLMGSITSQNKNNIILVFEEGATLFVSNGMNAPAISILQSNNWQIQNPTINGNMANQADASGQGGIGMALFGILINGGSNNLVDGATIINCGQFGVFISNTLSSSPAVNNGVINSRISYCGWNGITVGVYKQPSKDVDDYLKNNTIHHCDDVGISTYATRSLIENNTIYDNIVGTGRQLGWNNVGTGIQVEGGGSNTIRYNTVSNCRVGIMTNEPPFDYNTISYNIVRHCLDGIALRSSYNTVAQNTITDYNFLNNADGYYGKAISLLNANNNVVSENQISSTLAGANAIYLGNGIDNDILRNTIVDSAKQNSWSVEVYNSLRTDIEQNNITGLNGVGIVDTGSIGTVIRNNDLRGCIGVKIRDSGTGTITEGNLPP